MTAPLLSSKIVIEEEQPRTRTIEAVQTSVGVMVGITERGPINKPTMLTSFDEFEAVFGGFTEDADLALQAEGFFDEGGQFLYVIRVVHHLDITNPNSITATRGSQTLLTPATAATAARILGSNVGPYAIADGQTLGVNVDSAGVVEATFNAEAATLRSNNSQPYALADGQTLEVQVNGQTHEVEFLAVEVVDIAAVTAAEAAAIINSRVPGAFVTVDGNRPRITTDRQGTSAQVAVVGGTAAAAFDFPAVGDTGSGDFANAAAATAAEIAAVVGADIPALTAAGVGGALEMLSNTTGNSSRIQVSAGPVATALGLSTTVHRGGTGTPADTLRINAKTEGSYSGLLTLVIDDATNMEAESFNLTVLDDGIVREIFPNVTMDPNSPRYVETIVNDPTLNIGSNLIEAADLELGASSNRPANGTFGPLTGGSDGLVGLADSDFLGSAAGPTGLRTLDVVQTVNILTIPGRATSAIQNGMINYAENIRRMSMFAILDSPRGMNATQVVNYFTVTAGLVGLSEFGAAYWPWVKVLNPAPGIFGNSSDILVAPSGRIAGTYARVDGSRVGGVYLPPAGIEEGRLFTVLGFETDEVLDERKRDIVYPSRINILTTSPGNPRYIDGARCLKANGNFPYVSQRRGAIFIEQSVKNGTEYARHKNNTPELRRQVGRSVTQFLEVQMKNRAFASMDPDTAFFVDVSDKLNAGVTERGQMRANVGLAFNTPAEWIIFRFGRFNPAAAA